MKKIFIPLFLIGALSLISETLCAQNTLTVSHSTSDGIAAEITTALNGADATTIETLVIQGDANVTFNDCRAIRAAFTTSSLKTLDLSNAKFENDSLPGVPGSQSPNNVGAFNATTPYEEGVSPTDANGLNVTEVKLPVGIRVIGNRIFRKFKLLTTITLPSTVEHIGPAAFNVCEQLKYINFPTGLKRIDDYAFYQCYRLGLDPLNPVDELPEGLEGVLGASAFRETSCFFEYIPVGITAIGASCFKAGSTSAIILPGTSTHPSYNQESLSLTMYQNVASIAGGAFQGQKWIDNIEINRMTPPETGTDAFTGVGNGLLSAVDLYIPIGTEISYNIDPYMQMIQHAVLSPVSAVTKVESVKMNIYPNPAVDRISVSLEMGQIKSARILDLTGAIVSNLNISNNLSFDISSLSKGIYIFQLNDNTFSKFVKE